MEVHKGWIDSRKEENVGFCLLACAQQTESLGLFHGRYPLPISLLLALPAQLILSPSPILSSLLFWALLFFFSILLQILDSPTIFCSFPSLPSPLLYRPRYILDMAALSLAATPNAFDNTPLARSSAASFANEWRKHTHSLSLGFSQGTVNAPSRRATANMQQRQRLSLSQVFCQSTSTVPYVETPKETAKKAPVLPFRVGHGFDLHRLEPNLPLIIGGVNIPHDRGCEAHSDGDVLLHCVVDAILGALGLPDIGQIFPDNDPKWRGAPSSVFMKEAVRLMHEAGYELGNLDATLILQRPKLSPHKEFIRSNLCEFLGAHPSVVNIKAKTHEKVDSLGENRSIAAHTVVLLMKK